MKRSTKKRRQSRSLRRLGVETLESRQMLSVVAGYPVGPSVFDARDDMFVAAQGSQQNELSVLANDRDVYWGWGYRTVDLPSPLPQGDFGELVISSVSVPTAGSVQIDVDGKTILYTPPSDFTGIAKFQYTVTNVQDETQEAEVYVHVVNPAAAVRDWFQVEQGSSGVELDILSNDGGNAGGLLPVELTIVEVADLSHGGTASISEDGQTVVYTPEPGFVGLETMRYIVVDENGYRDEAIIHARVIETDPDEATLEIVRREELEQFILDQSVARWENTFGSPDWSSVNGYFADYRGYPERWLDVGQVVPFVVADQAFSMTTSGTTAVDTNAESFSNTNVQVEGVDEGDLVKTDGRYLYILSNRNDELGQHHEVVIVDAQDASELVVVSRLSLEHHVLEQYLHGDRLTVISSGYGWSYQPDLMANETVQVTVFDVSDPTDPAKLHETVIQGSRFGSRAIGDYVYLVTKANVDSTSVLPSPTTECFEESVGCFYETKQQYVDRIEPFLADAVAAYESHLPEFVSYDASGEVADSGLLGDSKQRLGLDDWGQSTYYASIASIDVAADVPAVVSATSVISQWSSEVYVAVDALYLLEADGGGTDIRKFGLAETGEIAYAASGFIDGHVLNQFSIDQHNGFLRVTTHGGNLWAGGNNLYVLQQVADQLEVVGEIEGLAPGENIYSTRFMGDRGFVVTFRKVDPLFVIDLSNPTSPELLGQLKVPGYSSYLQLIDENHLLGIGRDADERTGLYQGLQVSLFDLTDLTDPTLVDRYSFEGGRSTWSPLADAWNLKDHHAVSYFSGHQVLTIPFYSSGYSAGNNYAGVDNTPIFDDQTRSAVRVFQVDPERGFEVLGQVEFDARAHRTVRIGEVMYSLSTDTVKATELLKPENLLSELHVGRGAVDDRAETQSDTAIRIAVTANDLFVGAAEGEPEIVLVDQPVHGGVVSLAADGRSIDYTPPSGFFGKDTFRYSVAADSVREQGTVTVDVQWNWHNKDQPDDVNGDGLVTPLDMLMVIHWVNSRGVGSVSDAAMAAAGRSEDTGAGSMQPDVNDDGLITPLDVLMLINGRFSQTVAASELSSGEGEYVPTVYRNFVQTKSAVVSSVATQSAMVADNEPAHPIVDRPSKTSAAARVRFFDTLAGEPETDANTLVVELLEPIGMI